jgi:hypothetical protein
LERDTSGFDKQLKMLRFRIPMGAQREKGGSMDNATTLLCSFLQTGFIYEIPASTLDIDPCKWDKSLHIWSDSHPVVYCQ